MRGSAYTFAGSRSNQSTFSIDGTLMTDGVGEGVIGPLATFAESFTEVKVDLAGSTAESPSLGQVTIVSTSGTNQLSGAVFDDYQSPMFRARNPFSGTQARASPTCSDSAPAARRWSPRCTTAGAGPSGSSRGKPSRAARRPRT